MCKHLLIVLVLAIPGFTLGLRVKFDPTEKEPWSGPQKDMPSWWSGHFEKVLGDLANKQSSFSTPRRINVVMSFAPGDSSYSEMIHSTTKLGKDVTVVAYLKMPDSEKEVELAKGANYVVRGIPDKGHNEYAYFHHMANHYDDLADVEIFAKTNKVKHNDDISQMVQTARSGRHLYNSAPWVACRNIITYHCDKRWEGHELHNRLCSPEAVALRQSRFSKQNSSSSEWYFDELAFEDSSQRKTIIKSSNGGKHPAPFYDRVEEVKPQRPPLVWSGFVEGLFSVHSSLIKKYPQSFYSNVVSDFSTELATKVGGPNRFHDGVLIGLVPVLFAHEFEKEAPVWAVSPSYLSYQC